MEALDIYGISSWENGKDVRRTARQVRDMALAADLVNVAGRIEALAARGTRYSYEDFDVLSWALSEIRRADTADPFSRL